eukprot:5560639-Pyramimonas_sp.AAC.1
MGRPCEHSASKWTHEQRCASPALQSIQVNLPLVVASPCGHDPIAVPVQRRERRSATYIRGAREANSGPSAWHE